MHRGHLQRGGPRGVSGFSAIFDENHTGQDFDGDGKPEVVFITDTGGGNHCCWAYNVISLSPKPRKLFDIEAAGAVRFEKDNQGKMLIWERTAGPYGFTTMAYSLYPGQEKRTMHKPETKSENPA